MKKGNKFVKRPLLIMWSGMLLALIIAVANTDVDTDSATKDTAIKTSNTENIDKENEAKEETAEAKVKDSSSNLLYDPFGSDKTVLISLMEKMHRRFT